MDHATWENHDVTLLDQLSINPTGRVDEPRVDRPLEHEGRLGGSRVVVGRVDAARLEISTCEGHAKGVEAGELGRGDGKAREPDGGGEVGRGLEVGECEVMGRDVERVLARVGGEAGELEWALAVVGDAEVLDRVRVGYGEGA